MSCYPRTRDSIPRSAIYAILNRLVVALASTCRHKRRKYSDFLCAVRVLSSRSIDPRGGFAAFLGLRDSDPAKTCAVYIDNLKGEYDPNLGRHRVYHVAFVAYVDQGNILRTLKQPYSTIAGNADAQVGSSYVDGSVALKLFVAQANPILPAGYNQPLAGVTADVGGVNGTPTDVVAGDGFGFA